MGNFQGYFFQDFPWTLIFNFQDIPGPEIIKKKIPDFPGV